MDEEPDPSGEAVREEVDVDPAEVRAQGLAAAVARVTAMAKSTQAEVRHPQDTPPAIRLHSSSTLQNLWACCNMTPSPPRAGTRCSCEDGPFHAGGDCFVGLPQVIFTPTHTKLSTLDPQLCALSINDMRSPQPQTLSPNLRTLTSP